MRRKRLHICRRAGVLGLLLSLSALAVAQRDRAVTVHGRVFLPDNQPAVQVTVMITGQNGFNASARTDGRGGFRFEGIPPTIYSLTVTPPQDSRYYAEPVAVNALSDGTLFMADIFMRNPLEPSLKKEKNTSLISVKEASQNIPKNARKALDRARQYREQKKFDAALDEADKAIKLYPDYFQAFTEKGLVQVNSGRLPEALQNFNKALEMFPDYEPALGGAGYCYLSAGQYEQSIAALEKAVNLDATHSQNYLFLGIANLALSRWQKSQDALERALKLDANGAVAAHMYLADALAGQHLYARAADELHTYLEKNPEAPNADRLRKREKVLRSQKAPQQ